MIVSLWSGPRNLSTALMYFFAHRGDFVVMDEPFFGAFLKTYGLWRPSRELALKAMDLDPISIHKSIQDKALQGPLFLKNMANHLPLINYAESKEWKPVFLFRHPADVIKSYRRQMSEISLFDLAYKEQVEWMERLDEDQIPYYLLDSAQIQYQPEQELQKLCNWLQIPFSPSMLTWPAGALKEDGVWAPFWYQSVHASTGFQVRKAKSREISSALLEDALYQACLPYYQKLKDRYDEQV